MPDDSNNAIILYKAPKEYIDLVLNEIGPRHSTPVSISQARSTST